MKACKAIGFISSLVAGLLTGTAVAEVTMQTVFVGNPGNPADTNHYSVGGPSGYGSVAYTYSIGKYEVTSTQYTEFLNKVAGVDTYGLYNTLMQSGASPCGIERYAGSGTTADPYHYRVTAGYESRPVTTVSWADAARFANWMANGQPSGAQDATTTEDGSYYLNGAMTVNQIWAVSRDANATWVIPTEDEWFKAAYHKNDGVTQNYWDYPVASDTHNQTMANYNNSVGHSTDVGAYSSYPSAYGTFDQGGNVAEWNEVIWPTDGMRGERGGSYVQFGDYLWASYRGFTSGTTEGYNIGFRMALVPEPATMLLVTIGGLVISRRRSR